MCVQMTLLTYKIYMFAKQINTNTARQELGVIVEWGHETTEARVALVAMETHKHGCLPACCRLFTCVGFQGVADHGCDREMKTFLDLSLKWWQMWSGLANLSNKHCNPYLFILYSMQLLRHSHWIKMEAFRGLLLQYTMVREMMSNINYETSQIVYITLPNRKQYHNKLELSL